MLLGAILVIGTLGYMLLGLEPLDAVYQTLITVSTVGYREIGDVTGRYQVFTSLLIVFGTGTTLYTLGVLLETLFEGRLDDQFRRRRMQRGIDGLRGHTVVCGFGQVGRAITEELQRKDEPVVVVDRRELDASAGVTYFVSGEATEDEVLERAGIARADTLVLALDSDADNLYVTLSARSMRPDLFIVARANQSAATPKLHRAGADRVVNPHEIGGSRMAAMVLQPDVADFLDVVMHDRELEVRLAEVRIPVDSDLVGARLGACRIGELTGATVLAVGRTATFITNPGDELVLESSDVIIALGTPEQLAAVGSHVESG